MPLDLPTGQAVHVAVVLLNYNGWKDTLACLDSLMSSDRGVGAVFICDNASTDGSWAQLKEGLAKREDQIRSTWLRWWGESAVAKGTVQTVTRQDVNQGVRPHSPVVLVNNEGNWGFAKGNNVGLKLALRDPSFSYFWLLNNDTEVPNGTVGHLADACLRRPKVGLWGGTIIYHGHPDKVQALGGGSLNRSTAETRHIGAFMDAAEVAHTAGLTEQVEAEMDYALGACMWATRGWLDKVGLLGESYFLYYEEIDWALRGKPWFDLGYEPKAIVLHKEGASIGTAPSGGSPLSVFHLIRSRMIFARLHLAKAQLPGVLFRIIIQALKYLLKRRPALASATLRGARAGWGAAS